jgi:CHAD domain-containing protein
MARLAAALATWDGQPGAGPTAAEVVVERLDRAHRRVLRRGSRITDRSPAEDLHDLRKRAKELRYLLETFPRRRIRPTLASPSRS